MPLLLIDWLVLKRFLNFTELFVKILMDGLSCGRRWIHTSDHMCGRNRNGWPKLVMMVHGIMVLVVHHWMAIILAVKAGHLNSSQFVRGGMVMSIRCTEDHRLGRLRSLWWSTGIEDGRDGIGVHRQNVLNVMRWDIWRWSYWWSWFRWQFRLRLDISWYMSITMSSSHCMSPCSTWSVTIIVRSVKNRMWTISMVGWRGRISSSIWKGAPGTNFVPQNTTVEHST